jgi:anti-sigma factor RsiW
MRCARVEPLIERFVDGGCDLDRARAIEAHALGCVRCTARIAAARRLAAALDRPPHVRAPHGFAEMVMTKVYREALGGHSAAEVRAPRRTVGKMYRRLGFSFMVSALVLSASLVIPRGAYPTLIGTRGHDAGVGGSAAVRSVLQGADRTVRGILGEQQMGGNGQ